MALKSKPWGGRKNAAYTDGTPKQTIKSGPKA